MAFSNSPHRETPENAIKQNRESFLDLKCFVKVFFVVAFELPPLRNTPKHDKTKEAKDELTSNIEIFVDFLGIFFDIDAL
jgi:hypothetical protein